MERQPIPPFSQEDRRLLEPFLSDLDAPVYAIHGLPEEVIAVVFAYVSRSPRSFRENLLKLLREDLQAYAGASPLLPARASAEASAFHDKWVVGYGHSSVAEHAVVHLGVERISRLASAELELSNPFLSFTEYSQRYQQPRPGDWVLPPDLPAEGRQLAEETCAELYGLYRRLLEELSEALRREVPRRPDESDEAYARRRRRQAFEDARFTLPLATATQLGLTANARALRDAIRRLLASPYPEVVALATALRQAAEHDVPTLLRHAEPDPAWEAWREAAAATPGSVRATGARGAGEAAGATSPVATGGAARLLEPEPPQVALERFARAWTAMLPGEEAAPAELFAHAAAALGEHREAPPPFHALHYRFEVELSEAAWHQLLRHNRRCQFYPGPPGAAGGWTIPPAVEQAGLGGRLEVALEKAESTARRLAALSPTAAHYLVLNAQRRRVRAEMDLAELIHLAELRGKPEAQWEIRGLVRAMVREAVRAHPFLAGVPALGALAL
ncbi:MAG: FAD-dependent thymidylate synthase [Bacillota bacterium]|nr:FAD-dependent thymidylate synthase [Bacillota bacterium]